MADEFEDRTPGLTSPGSTHAAITPSDTTGLDPAPRAIFIGGAGDVVVRDKNGDDATYTIAAVPYILPFRGVRVLATGTTATNLVGIS